MSRGAPVYALPRRRIRGRIELRIVSEQALSSHYLFDAIWLKVHRLYLLGTVQRDEAHGESCDLPLLLLSVLVPPADERDGISPLKC